MKILTEHKSKKLLAEYGIPVTREAVAKKRGDALLLADKIGFPVAMKISSPDIAHKHDAGCVLLDVKKRDVGAAYKMLMENAKKYAPDARIDGVLIQEMVPRGTEIIIGIKYDPQFGHAVMFGLGGVFVEVLEDVSFRIVPLKERDAIEMTEEIRGRSILADCEMGSIVSTILKVSEMAAKENILELDINPLIVYEKGVVAVDARAVLGG
uniref:acetate--CoA ligase (ADP-forming) n=1 Tax=Candidatus Methanogaster sp. ANME-2c ERB4 TaxID=2759911 RepID=A0A7G9YP87_9EURY|nr:acetate--CoA ligase [ADP-forming] II subunit beta [Methanosarcinales archaeon ANME-2c ERB4]QNO49960.1 acetate--CoA ligase [ADP-forming] II subunit beta [Methanosarcinales archaeon ANME-2c ERB4]